MAEAEELTQIDLEELKNLIALRDTREDVLRELNQQEGARKASNLESRKLVMRSPKRDESGMEKK